TAGRLPGQLTLSPDSQTRVPASRSHNVSALPPARALPGGDRFPSRDSRLTGNQTAMASARGDEVISGNSGMTGVRRHRRGGQAARSRKLGADTFGRTHSMAG